MANSLILNTDTIGITDATTRFIQLVGSFSAQVTEVNAEIPIRDAGTFSNLFVYVSTNTASVTSTITLRKSQVDTSLTVSYTADQTGIKEDTSNSVLFAATDEIDYEVTVPTEVGTNTITIELIGLQFAPTTTTDSITILGNSGTSTTALNAGTRYLIPSGAISFTISTEANIKYRARFSFTSSDFYTYVSANARITDVVIGTRKNGAAGAQSLTYTSGQTGAKEDTVNTDSLVAGDDFNFIFTTNAGAENITFTIKVIMIAC